MTRTLVPVAVLLATIAGIGLVRGPASVPAQESAQDGTDVLGGNVACVVCHIPFVKEELAKTHLAHEVTCVKCHGPSIKHANDEHIGASKPDVTYTRDQIDAACRKCHARHDVPARAVIARFLDRKLPARPAPSCTECHGRHKIEKAAEPVAP